MFRTITYRGAEALHHLSATGVIKRKLEAVLKRSMPLLIFVPNDTLTPYESNVLTIVNTYSPSVA